MKFTALSAFLALVGVVVHAHDDHDHASQMPMGYVKYPYQAQYYPGDNEGGLFVVLNIPVSVSLSDPLSHGRLHLLRYYDLRQAPMGAVPGERPGHVIRHCFHRRTFRTSPQELLVRVS